MMNRPAARTVPANFSFLDVAGTRKDQPVSGKKPDAASSATHGNWKIFVLNLDRATDRMAHMDAMLQKLGLPYERISAVDGTKLTPSDWNSSHTPALFALFFGRRMSAGELGCALAHRKAYLRILEENLDWALILEDDIDLSPDLPGLLEEAVTATAAFDVFQLYYSENKPHRVVNVGSFADRRIITFTGSHASAIAYVVRQSGARKFLKFRKVFLPADKFIWMNALNRLSFCACMDFLAKPHEPLNEKSNIDATDRITLERGRINAKNRIWKLVVRPLMLAIRATLVKAQH